MITMALRREEVRRWLQGQKEAGKRMEQERIRWLRTLRQEEALKVYLDLVASRPPQGETLPSPLLWFMRKAVGKL